MLIGTSLGRCLISLLKGEVREEDVMVIITGTDCPNYDDYISVVEHYYENGNPRSRNVDDYKFVDISLDDVIDLADRLWHKGLIHQPRIFGAAPYRSTSSIWLDVMPVPDDSNEGIVEAWNQYRTLAILAQ